MAAFAEEIAGLRLELDRAADTLLNAASEGLARLREARAGSTDALDGVQAALQAVLEACAFQDLAGQRLSRLAAAVHGEAQAVDPLLNGPAEPGRGLDQAAADALFSDAPRPD